MLAFHAWEIAFHEIDFIYNPLYTLVKHNNLATDLDCRNRIARIKPFLWQWPENRCVKMNLARFLNTFDDFPRQSSKLARVLS